MLNYLETTAHKLLVRQLPADTETPVTTYLKLCAAGSAALGTCAPSFLLESVIGGEQVARYSFIGVLPRRLFILKNDCWEIRRPDGTLEKFHSVDTADPLAALQSALPSTQPVTEIVGSMPAGGLPRFTGGLVGYLGYAIARYYEPSLSLAPAPDQPDALFIQADTIVAFDHVFDRLLLLTRLEAGELLDAAEARLDWIETHLRDPLPVVPPPQQFSGVANYQAVLSQPEFEALVDRVKIHIASGDIFQAVLSQQLHLNTSASAFSIYRELRRLNPSPYMFFINFGELSRGNHLQLIGASPETHVRLEGSRVTLRPIAGTRRRGHTSAEDETLKQDLLADAKERAEHVMLVDLARNDLGRVCRYGSVTVPEFMSVEYYSHVMHIVSSVQGDLNPGMSAFDLIKATFPAGTVSGAPKIRAMQLIDQFEPAPRGIYAGLVGYFSYDGSFDSCITIRTLVMQNRQVTIQAGAGIVADSLPANEYHETLNKARALAEAVRRAELAR